jgi:hypothetical protein
MSYFTIGIVFRRFHFRFIFLLNLSLYSFCPNRFRDPAAPKCLQIESREASSPGIDPSHHVMQHPRSTQDPVPQHVSNAIGRSQSYAVRQWRFSAEQGAWVMLTAQQVVPLSPPLRRACVCVRAFA